MKQLSRERLVEVVARALAVQHDSWMKRDYRVLSATSWQRDWERDALWAPQIGGDERWDQPLSSFYKGFKATKTPSQINLLEIEIKWGGMSCGGTNVLDLGRGKWEFGCSEKHM